ncbi:MAG: tryptophan synthase subunit alpha [Nitrososphaerota archaeon]|nr:tryptophan synthase subunit alpha [Nitrososphaerota archaeon]MDG6966939.1 tryptophan synthase subunit alpha [Nitrososphaerota archaeon]MDG6978743.1 tryptophan synthase subunit alpha [Nitrososphaerota archaeon]MDG7005838.1 tryptophan synthase subunit alpha [Nitrososphaerota archaeon]MDG7021499.1 tryptophan synthase subunit alpha [Nitrososphaerota archaeon]
MGGDPDLATSGAVIDAVVRGGADILEVGIPFSDPIADGKSIQAADVRSLASGATPAKVLDLVSKARSRHPGVPVVVMTYYNILYSNGLEGFLERAKAHGVDGLIVPDLPFDEIEGYAPLARRHGLDAVLLAAPTTSPSRMKAIAAHTSGFLYLVSLTGVTGARQAVGEGALDLVRRVKRSAPRVPVAVGFGISAPEHVGAMLGAGADAVVVGSAIVDRVERSEKDGTAAMLSAVEGYVRTMKAATKGA